MKTSTTQISFSSDSEKFLKPFFDKGLSYEILSKNDFTKSVYDCFGEMGLSDDCDGFYLHPFKKIILENKLVKDKNLLLSVFFHEFIHMIRLQEPELLGTKPVSFMPELLYHLYNKKFKGISIIEGVEEFKVFMHKWREEAVCELLSQFLLMGLEKMKRTDFQIIKPTFVYLISGGFDEDDQFQFKDVIYQDCLKTINLINTVSDKKLNHESFLSNFEQEYEISIARVEEINEHIKATPMVKTYNAFRKRVFF